MNSRAIVGLMYKYTGIERYLSQSSSKIKCLYEKVQSSSSSPVNIALCNLQNKVIIFLLEFPSFSIYISHESNSGNVLIQIRI